MGAVCTLDYCDRSGRNKGGGGPCEGHYYQQRRGRPFSPLQERTGGAGDPCDAEGCDQARIRGRYCRKHAARIARHGDPLVVIGPGQRAAPTGPDNPMWTEAPGYATVHQRLQRTRGSARTRTCGCGSPAEHWAYTGPRLPGELHPFSADLGSYEAMCVPCHKAMDLAALGLAARD